MDSSASDFYVGFARNDADEPMAPTLVQQLLITTREPDPVPYMVQTLLGFNFTGIAMPNRTTVVPLGNTYQVFSSEERDKGIHVSAGNKQIIVYGMNYHNLTSGAFLALPCSRFAVDEYEYYGISYTDFTGEYYNQLLFVGCEDNTTVNIKSTTIILNRMETYLYEMRNETTGTRIVTNKPVSFFSGSQCTYVPSQVLFCDHITEQFPPTITWGSRFLSASFSGKFSGEVYRMLTSEPSTNVTVNCTTYSQAQAYALITAGAWQEFTTPANSFCLIEANNPIFVAEFAFGYSNDSVGDPLMMIVPPIEQYCTRNSFILNALPEFSTNYITMFVTPEHFQPEKILIDDRSQDEANWKTIHCLNGTVCGYVAYASFAEGEHHLYHKDTFAVIGVAAYGFSFHNAYGYPACLQLNPIQCKYVYQIYACTINQVEYSILVTLVSFSQATYFVQENEQNLRVSISRSGDIDSFTVALVANDPYESTATGN